MWKDLFSFSWWRQTLNSLTTANISQRWAQIVAVFHNPRINPVLFLMVLAVIVVIVLILVLVIVMIVSAASSHKDRFALVDAKGKEVSKLSEADAKAKAVGTYRRSWKRYSTVLTIVVGAFLVLVCIGAGTSTSTYCKACHGNDKKVAVMQSGDHRNLSCVQCHEGGGTFARYTTNVVQRVGHLLTGMNSNSQPTGYISVPTSACLNCHDKSITGDTVATNLGNNTIAMSHKEPMAASMQCTRCHNLTTAKSPVATRNTMNTCLICHNGSTAPSSCTTCHVNDPSLTIASSGPSPSNADRLISTDPKTQCYVCHEKDAASCDACHGLRLPHPADFQDTHPAAVLKYGLSTCLKCHNDKDTSAGEASGGAQPCTECHSNAGGQWDFQGYLSSGGGAATGPTTHTVYIEATGQYVQEPGAK